MKTASATKSNGIPICSMREDGTDYRGNAGRNLESRKINRSLNVSPCEMVHCQECINPRERIPFVRY